MGDILILVAFFALILGSGVIATNIYCQFAYNRCGQCGCMNAKRRSQCRNCSAALG